MQKTVFIIPGFKQKPNQKAYQRIARLLNNEGYHPILVSIPWRKGTITENTAYFLEEYKKVKVRKKYIVGFSFGAMIAFLAATKVKASGLILCSLSPYFRDDVLPVKKTKTTPLARQQYEDFLCLDSTTLAKQIKTKQILMLYGTKEAKSLTKRVKQTYQEVVSPQKALIPIKKTDHTIGDRRYLQAIGEATRKLL